MKKDLREKTSNTEKKEYIVNTISEKLGDREDVTLKQPHNNDFDIKLGSRSIVRIVANKTTESNGVALFRIASEYLQDIKKLELVKGYVNCYNIEEIDRTESCFYRFNYETVGLATNSALAIFDYIDKAVREKKQETKKQETKTEDSKTDSKKQEKKTDSKKQETAKKTETAKKQDKKTGNKKQK